MVLSIFLIAYHSYNPQVIEKRKKTIIIPANFGHIRHEVGFKKKENSNNFLKRKA